ncbi:hypothetical protein DL93DRAFT_1711512 [Clavulina sp. PMI_390]|nr:hypothetical protein DL93DRAFT_1711512 [Clavulina sp. PMI_390]
MPKFNVTINEADSTIQGSGADHPGSFAIAGILKGDEYVGKRLEPKGRIYQFSGGWGQGSAQYGQWVLSGVAAPPAEKPHHPIEGQWSGTYQYANNVSQKDGPMNFTISLDDSVPYQAAGPYAITGTGTDSIGPFTLKGTVAASNDVDITKTYNVGGRTWSWRYQGLFGDGAIGGIWREINDDSAPSRGSFQLIQQQGLPKATAQAIVPPTRSLSTGPTTSPVQAAVTALKGKNTRVPAATLDGLLTGFGSVVG